MPTLIRLVRLTPHDAALLNRLVQFHRLPIEKRRELLNQIESAKARQVGEAVLDSAKLSELSEDVRETANRYQRWLENNKRLDQVRQRARRSNETRARL